MALSEIEDYNFYISSTHTLQYFSYHKISQKSFVLFPPSSHPSSPPILSSCLSGYHNRAGRRLLSCLSKRKRGALLSPQWIGTEETGDWKGRESLWRQFTFILSDSPHTACPRSVSLLSLWSVSWPFMLPPPQSSQCAASLRIGRIKNSLSICSFCSILAPDTVHAYKFSLGANTFYSSNCGFKRVFTQNWHWLCLKATVMPVKEDVHTTPMH